HTDRTPLETASTLGRATAVRRRLEAVGGQLGFTETVLAVQARIDANLVDRADRAVVRIVQVRLVAVAVLAARSDVDRVLAHVVNAGRRRHSLVDTVLVRHARGAGSGHLAAAEAVAPVGHERQAEVEARL